MRGSAEVTATKALGQSLNDVKIEGNKFTNELCSVPQGAYEISTYYVSRIVLDTL